MPELGENNLTHIESAESKTIASDLVKPKVGDWFWIDEKWFACVTHIGTNYANVEGPGGYVERIHAKEFSSRCVLEPEPELHIDNKIAHHKRELSRLTEEIKELTTTLGLSAVSLTEGSVSALATRTNENAVEEYKTALVLAKEKTLPELFSQVRSTSESLKTWLSATTIPLKAQVDDFKDLIKTVENRIFNVELYAGLVETVELIADGKEAPIGEKVRLMQRRAYMDEECLAEYKTGGMDFDGIGDFDCWMAKPENYNRILPFPRCVIAFQVRRNNKEREAVTFAEFISIHIKEQEDKATFLYMRNGEKLYRLSTAIDFGQKLFPDIEASFLNSQVLYAKTSFDRVREIISEHEYTDMVEEEKRKEAELKKKLKGLPKSKHWEHSSVWIRSTEYKLFSPDNVMFDDIEAELKSKVDEHNRLVIVLQGLMDRSPVFHPHPKFSLWEEKDFSAAFELVYDSSRALVGGDRPDFEALRELLNDQLRQGCVTAGQEEQWEINEAVKECNRLDNDWRCSKQHYRPTHYRPHGDPGPGRLATVEKYLSRARKCVYKWERERRTYSYYKEGNIPCSLTLPSAQILNVSAYEPGMFKPFFADPRTRADYLRWAPLLLSAEEFHAGNKDGKPKKKNKS